jgi:hypothetical protein
MSFLTQSMWTHGNSMHIEYPECLDSVQRKDSGIRVQGKNGTTNLFHFAIPSSTIVDSEAMQLAAVFLRFRTASADTYIQEVYLYDGEERFAEFKQLNLAPEEFCTKRFDPPLYRMQYGLGVSIFAVFGEEPSSNIMEFSSAGGNFARNINSNLPGKKSAKIVKNKKLQYRRR